jgi:hypothetical protein
MENLKSRWRPHLSELIKMNGYENNWVISGKLDLNLLKQKAADWYGSERRRLEAKNGLFQLVKDPEMDTCEMW